MAAARPLRTALSIVSGHPVSVHAPARTKPGSRVPARGRLRETLGAVHVVCNNAGVALRSPILETSDENFDWLLAVNIGGIFNVTKAFVPR